MAIEHDYKNFPELTNTQINEFGFTSPHIQITENFEARVVKVTDGDTYRLSVNFRDFEFPLRLANVDTPELNNNGDRARDFVQHEIEGSMVTVLIDKNNRVGKYGRLLGRVLTRGLDLSDMLILKGLAVPFGKKNEGLIPNSDKIFSLKQWLTT